MALHVLAVSACVCACVPLCGYNHMHAGWSAYVRAHVLMQSFPQISHSSPFSVVYGYVTTITREKRGRNKVSVKD